MHYLIKHPLLLSSLLLWLGFILAISFMEAWLKFRAPGVTLPIGLGIGRIVFNVLNKIEFVFALTLVIHVVFYLKGFQTGQLILSGVLIVILLIQTIWLLPQLDARADQLIQGIEVSKSNLHFYYVIAEVLKLIALVILTITLFKKV